MKAAANTVGPSSDQTCGTDATTSIIKNWINLSLSNYIDSRYSEEKRNTDTEKCVLSLIHTCALGFLHCYIDQPVAHIVTLYVWIDISDI